MCVDAELHPVDLISSHQFEKEIGAASSENELSIAKMKFSVRTAASLESERCYRINFRSPPRRQVAGEQRHTCQQQRKPDKRQRF
jgi:hypothetical protein